jgi:hypothetical protein
MIPTDFFFIDRMPQLPSGKVDKKALETEYFRSHGRSNSLVGEASSTDILCLTLFPYDIIYLGHHD